MRCPHCPKGETHVVDSRDDEQAIRRRRECLACNARFTTFERIEITNLMVVKRSGGQEAFSREKLISGIKRAGEKRPLVLNQVDRMAEEIERSFSDQCLSTVSSDIIGQEVLKRLEKIDSIAYLRFASVHRSFNDLGAFETELAKIHSIKDA